MTPNVTGVVLAGGESKRFGRNKAFEVFEGEQLIDRNIILLEKFCADIFVIANNVELYAGKNATIIKDVVPFFGPLGGIYTALLFSMNDWIFVRAVDMPFLANDLVTLMLQYIHNNFDVIIPASDKGYEPLCALYNRRCIPHIAKSIEKDDRRIISFFRRVRIKEITPRDWQRFDPKGISFININTINELSRVSSEFSRSP